MRFLVDNDPSKLWKNENSEGLENDSYLFKKYWAWGLLRAPSWTGLINLFAIQYIHVEINLKNPQSNYLMLKLLLLYTLPCSSSFYFKYDLFVRADL